MPQPDGLLAEEGQRGGPMCRMAAMISSKPVNISMLVGWLSDLALRKDQCDGWGLVAYLRSSPILYLREPTPIWERPPLHFPKANLALVHARKASQGSISFLNSHPFVKIFERKFWSFCHNGSVKRDVLLRELDLKPLGDTDSEVLFLHILSGLKGSNLNEPRDILEHLREIASELRKKEEELGITAVNFILTDGSSLFALRGASLKEEWYTLWVWDREEGRPGRPTLSIISSEPVPEEREFWKSLPNWTLVGRWFEEGTLVKEEIKV